MGESIRISPRGEQVEGRYANHFKVGYNAFEFVLDFGQFYPEYGNSAFHTRIITSPSYAKELMGVLQDSIIEYEQIHGKIKINDENS